MKVSRVTTQNNKQAMIKAMVISDFSVSIACKIVGIYPSTHYRWLKKDEKYVANSKLSFQREMKRLNRNYHRIQNEFYDDFFKIMADSNKW